jgi:NAD(P)-dependent dehydrogenase (short-subunit alcohol dehydrogenase family)
MKASFDFKDNNVFVFGGTSGINLGIARCFAAAGASVAVASRSQEKVDAAVAELKSLGSSASGYALDVRDAEAVQAALAEHDAAAGALDILISGAAGNFPAFAKDMSPNGFKSVVDIDLLGTFHVLRSAFQYLKKPGASVINISAPQAFVPMPIRGRSRSNGEPTGFASTVLRPARLPTPRACAGLRPAKRLPINTRRVCRCSDSERPKR